MTTGTGLREVTEADLDEVLERVLVPRLADLLSGRGSGHCMRVNDLSAPLATVLARRLRRALGDAVQVHVLGGSPRVPEDVAVTGTKLVELRNPAPGGALRPALLVFVPPGSHASAEDSFGVATFEVVALGDLHADLVRRLLAGIPEDLRAAIVDVFDAIDSEVGPDGIIGDGDASRARFLLTVALNDNDSEAAGAALFELGLVPDFELFRERSTVRTRVSRNIRQVQLLDHADRSVRQRVIDLRLRDGAFRARLAELLVRTGLDDVRSWTRRIVADPANWPLSFHLWPLPDDLPTQSVELTMGELVLPRAGDRPEHGQHAVLGSITGQPYLIAGSSGQAQLPAPFEVRSDPRLVTGLARFVVQLVSEDSGPTGVQASVAVSTTARRAYRATLKRLRSAHLDPGWHYLRVQPIGHDNLPMPVEPGDPGTDRRPEESERFFVIGSDGLDEIPPAPRTRRSAGVTQELRYLELAAASEGRDPHGIECTSVAWRTDAGCALEIVLGSHGLVEVPLSPVLTEAERVILSEPRRLAPLRVLSASGLPARLSPHAAEESDSSPREPDLVGGEDVDAFVRARADVLAAIRGEDELIVAGRDILTMRKQVVAYAEAYAELLTRELQRVERADDRLDALRRLSTLLRIDTVVVEHRDSQDAATEITMVAPTHPLRLLWLLAWAEMGRAWAARQTQADSSTSWSLTDSLSALRASGFPLVVPRESGRLTVAAGDAGPHWQLNVSSETSDPRTLLADVAASLGIPERDREHGEVSPSRLADHVERYVRMHPYAQQLVICVVNAGRGAQVADMLLELQRRATTRHLCYDVRLFGAAGNTSEAGEALADLLNGRWRNTAESEEFQTPTLGGSTPKLCVAVRPVSEFRSATSRHSAHVTFLFDAFGGEAFEIGPAATSATPPVHGLVQDLVVEYVEDDDTVAWHKQPRHGTAAELTDAEEVSDLLTALPGIVSRAAAAVSTGETGTGQVPRVTLSLTPADRALLHQAHQSSDWVVTVDRTLGVEFFDSPGSMRRPDYVIDFVTTGPLGAGDQVVVSSRSVDELNALLAPMMEQHGFRVDRRHAGTFFDQLRLLSGRLAFKIASTAPNQRTEVLGLALARLYLAYQGVLDDQILVPLDSHPELYREARRRVDEVPEAAGLQRTDLALFTLDARRRTVTCRLVEVKCYTSLSGVGDQQRVREQVAGQLQRSAEVLGQNFDPDHYTPDRPDRLVRNAEMAGLLRFHLGRATRHGVMQPDASTEAAWLLDNLDRGYAWNSTRTGLIFDLSGQGIRRDMDGGIEYHTLGRDVVEELLGALHTDPVLAAGPGTDTTSTTDATRTLARDEGAAFRAPARSHEIPVDEPRDTPPSVYVEESPEPGAGRLQRRPPDVTPSPQAEQRRRGASSDSPPIAHSHPSDSEPATARAATSTPQGREGVAATNPDVYLGSAGSSPQYGVVGEAVGRRLALDLNETHTISLFGVQGGGKSYTLGSIIEAASLPAPPVNQLPSPLATIVFHYSPTSDYAPEFTSMVAANDNAAQVQPLRDRYGVEPAGLSDVVMLVPASQIARRRDEYPSIDVRALTFASTELQARHWRFLMGAVGNQSTYVRQLNRIMRTVRNNLTLPAIRDGVDASSLSDAVKQLAHQRLDLAADYIDDATRVSDLVRPGRMIIVDLRDDLIEKDEALGLFVVLMELFAAATSEGSESFNKLVVFDEAHKYIESPDLVVSLIESVREMRHKGMSVLVASQDPPSVPLALIELSDVTILHRFNSPAWLKHLQKANTALADLTSAKLNALGPGEAYVWAGQATDPAFIRGAVKVNLRPRITRHGGATRTAVDGS